MTTLMALMALSDPVVNWVRTMDEARARAAESGRPILWFQLLGDLDQEFC
jgi:hypothetical protein